MITRKITYRGNFTTQTVGDMFNITRNNEITGQVKHVNDQQVDLLLEGDPSQIKLIQHQIERKVKTAIKDKTVEPMEMQYFVGVNLMM